MSIPTPYWRLGVGFAWPIMGKQSEHFFDESGTRCANVMTVTRMLLSVT